MNYQFVSSLVFACWLPGLSGSHGGIGPRRRPSGVGIRAGGVYLSHVRLETILSHIFIRDIKIKIVSEQNKIFQKR